MTRSKFPLALWMVSGWLSMHASGFAFDCAGVDPSPGTAIKLKNITSSLRNPVDIKAPPGDVDRLFVVEQDGYISIINLSDDSLRTPAFLDIHTRVVAGGEKGLLGLAFHPDFAQNGYFYVSYTASAVTGGFDSQIKVSRFQVTEGEPNNANEDSEKVIFKYDHLFSNHNGGALAFSPVDGYLYFSSGDGGSGGDPNNNAQNPKSYMGKLLRFDVDGGDPYAIPESNPFAGRDDAHPEIWALGLRNPWRFSFDSKTGDLYIGDVGQDIWEEVDFQPASSAGGENYEWKVREGDHSFSGVSFTLGARVKPIFDYNHSSGTIRGRSVTGGLVYRGCRIPELDGVYFFADYNADWVRTFRYENGQVLEMTDRTAELNTGIAPDVVDDISAFGEDGRGELYICDLPNKLHRIVSANPPVPSASFRRGDGNADQTADVSDVIYLLSHLFLSQPATVSCQDALDSNDDGGLDIADAVFSLLIFFKGESQFPPPGLDCSTDPTASDLLGCQTSTCQ